MPDQPRVELLTRLGSHRAKRSAVVTPDDSATVGALLEHAGRHRDHRPRSPGGRMAIPLRTRRHGDRPHCVRQGPRPRSQRGVINVDAGVSLDTLMRLLLPFGYFMLVTPGAQFVTIGGAISPPTSTERTTTRATGHRELTSSRSLCTPRRARSLSRPKATPGVLGHCRRHGTRGCDHRATLRPAPDRNFVDRRRHRSRPRSRHVDRDDARRRRPLSLLRGVGLTTLRLVRPARPVGARSGRPRPARCAPATVVIGRFGWTTARSSTRRRESRRAAQPLHGPCVQRGN